MAKNSSIFKIEGTIDDVTFYKTQDGYQVRKKGGVNKRRILKDPAFKRTRENMSQFSINTKMGKLLRDSVAPFLARAKDRRLSSRIVQLMSKMAQYDTDSSRGEKQIANAIQDPEVIKLFLNFDCNQNVPLTSILKTPYFYEQATNTLSIPDMIPENHLFFPSGTSHVSFQIAYTAIDFETSSFETYYSEQETLSVSSPKVTVSLQPTQIPAANPTKSIFVFLIIEFLLEDNNTLYPLANKAFNALRIIHCE